MSRTAVAASETILSVMRFHVWQRDCRSMRPISPRPPAHHCARNRGYQLLDRRYQPETDAEDRPPIARCVRAARRDPPDIAAWTVRIAQYDGHAVRPRYRGARAARRGHWLPASCHPAETAAV